MPKFEAATVVDPLAYSLMPFASEEGTVKEPNDQQIATFLAGIKTITAEIKENLPNIPEDATPDVLMAAMDDLDTDVFLKMSGKMADVFSALCSGKPSKETLLALPPRIRNVFYGWLQEQVMDPEVVSADGKAALNGQK